MKLPYPPDAHLVSLLRWSSDVENNLVGRVSVVTVSFHQELIHLAATLLATRLLPYGFPHFLRQDYVKRSCCLDPGDAMILCYAYMLVSNNSRGVAGHVPISAVSY